MFLELNDLKILNSFTECTSESIFTDFYQARDHKLQQLNLYLWQMPVRTRLLRRGYT